jgi:hypothetical protein
VGDGSGSGSGDGKGLGVEKGNWSGIEVFADSSLSELEVFGSSLSEGRRRNATTNGVRPMSVRPTILRILEGVHRTRKATSLAGSSLDYRRQVFVAGGILGGQIEGRPGRQPS